MWYNIDSTNAMLVCRRKGGQNVTDRQDYRFILQIEPGRYAGQWKPGAFSDSHAFSLEHILLLHRAGTVVNRQRTNGDDHEDEDTDR